MQYYDKHKKDIIDRIDVVINTVQLRLLPTFDNIEEEANQVEKTKLNELNTNFNPYTMDEYLCYEEAHSEGAMHYFIYKEMKQEFLNHQATLLFHLFEKDCQKIFENLSGDEKKEFLIELGINISPESNWMKTNKELRFLANAIKHGNGNSFEKLKELRPDLTQDTFHFFFDSKIEITIEELSNYANQMKNFWEDFFEKALNKESENLINQRRRKSDQCDL